MHCRNNQGKNKGKILSSDLPHSEQTMVCTSESHSNYCQAIQRKKEKGAEEDKDVIDFYLIPEEKKYETY